MPVTTKFNLGVSFVKSGGSGTPSASGGVGPLKLVYEQDYDSDGFLISSDTTITGTPKTIVLPDNPYEELRFYCYIQGGNTPNVLEPISLVQASWSKGAYANSISKGAANTGGANSRIVQSSDSVYGNLEYKIRPSTEDNLKISIAGIQEWHDPIAMWFNYLPATRTLTLDPKVTRTSAQMADTTLQTKLQMIIILGR